ncbi:hypothetical protein H072_6965 [Dactylellina haptotyla CBS 200.50]|uniref:Cyclin N-terminal domain-containing protein n=1 Tax=Dactylellina haptotyla (strain CBS 200.50) TaxID=1284197 RepID=S8A8S1_DACHA|nr:hypothetical protein H072_6965 [Dactylellina haptotyla CBS 200.50]
MNSATLAYPQDSMPPFPAYSSRRNSAYSAVDSRSRSDYYARATNESTRIFSIPSPNSNHSSRYSSRESLRTPPSASTVSSGTMSCGSTDYSTALLPTSGNVQNSRSHTRQYDHSSQPSIPSMSECFRSSKSQELIKRKASSPPSRRGSFAQQMRDEARSRRSSSSLAPPLTVPLSINDSKGSLAEFAAQITCLFWFESSTDLARVAASSTPVTPSSILIPDAIPSMSFKKWVATILSTTQVSQNVILLALLFIYRLKKLNPSVKGKVGSEYRLLTVALMLGNKFLDDNTYTNKTWAEVSGITVGEIHVMEVEFLSNMRYSLFTSESEWHDWHVKLGRFGDYWERAQRVPSSSLIHQFSSITPTNTVAPSLPSPPASNHASPPYISSHSPNAYPLALPTGAPVTNVSPKNHSLLQRYREDLDRLESTNRKRGLEDVGMQPPAKRLSRSGPSSSSMLSQYPPALTIPTPSPNPYALHMPINPNAPMPIPPAALQPQSFYPATRAMSTVYPSSTASWVSSQTATSGWTPQPVQLPAATNPAPTPLSSIGVPSYTTSRHTSPYLLNSNNNSPIAYTNNNSPSVFLTSRESPYRPVRTVSTLLVPQQAAEAQHLGHDQMQYQPLTKARNEYRQGPVPYMQTEYWPQTTNWSLPPPTFEP